MSKRIPITFVHDPPPVAYPFGKAAKALGISKTTLWRDVAAGKITPGPHKIFAVKEMERYATQEQ